MIHHLSIPARDPQRVARVLSDLAGWKVRPFPGPLPGGLVLVSGDEHGTTIEIYPDGMVMRPGEGDGQGEFEPGEAPALLPFHFLWSLDVAPDAVLAAAEREGWRALRCWRGPPGRPLFELIEFWIENRLMIEIATPSMLGDYLKTTELLASGALGPREPVA
jgi:hypothetical protein